MSHTHTLNPEQLQRLMETLRQAKLKITQPRMALLSILLQEHGPFTIEELAVRLGDRSCDPATIYRNMSAFRDINLVRHCDFGDGVARYELAGDDHEHHHHIICRRCHRLEQIDYCFVKELEKFVRDKGYAQVSHSLEFYGICTVCQKAEGITAEA
jgi:Fur family ferric uptake transcriptional regulator